jgi:hypothetical protein
MTSIYVYKNVLTSPLTLSCITTAVYYPTVIVELLNMQSASSAVERFQNRLANQVSSITAANIFDDENTSGICSP